jgi:selenide,water dikinase
MVGLETSDDAAVYKLNNNQALINTVDFFPPMVDDPYLFGQIAAANALSDIYAMGGKPLLALNLVCYPSCLPREILSEILRGGAEKVLEAEAIIAGGHTVEDDEPKYGLAVTGIVHPDKVTANSHAGAGDLLVLTKPLGTGIINTAVKGDLAGEDVINRATETMRILNKDAAEVMINTGARACTDITGFGLLGHTAEMAEASNVSVEIWAKEIPLLPGTMDLAAMGMIPAGAYNNRQYLQEKVNFKGQIKSELELALFDPQTSGGLLIAIPQDKADRLMQELAGAGVEGAAIIGRVLRQGNYLIDVML